MIGVNDSFFVFEMWSAVFLFSALLLLGGTDECLNTTLFDSLLNTDNVNLRDSSTYFIYLHVS